MSAATDTSSRRARLWGLARATRDTYMPRLASSVSQFTGGRTPDPEEGPSLAYPRGTTFTLYPLYARLRENTNGNNGSNGDNGGNRGVGSYRNSGDRETPGNGVYGTRGLQVTQGPQSTSSATLLPERVTLDGWGHTDSSSGKDSSSGFLHKSDPANKSGPSRKPPPSYIVTLHGCMWSPGVMSRKNRLILSLARQITRFGASALQAVVRLEYDPELTQDTPDDALVVSAATTDSASTSSSSSGSDADLRVRERMALFIARQIAHARVNVEIGAAVAGVSSLVRTSVVTDANGFFDAEVEVPYEPATVQVSAQADSSVCASQDVCVVASRGLAVISDIDDTVKLTGVTGDKRELMRRLLVGDVALWTLPAVVAWYRQLGTRGVTFHYVLNLPWQLFALINEYFATVRLPPGSVHLKQYTGNIVLVLMEPLSSRKRTALMRLVADFPNKRFVCVGDLGERDCEAYAELAAAWPGRVRCIYIRVVPDSLLDVNDDNVLGEIEWMISEWTRRQGQRVPDLIDMDTLVENQQVDGLKVEGQRASRLPPMVPRKPAALRGTKQGGDKSEDTTNFQSDSQREGLEEDEGEDLRDLERNALRDLHREDLRDIQRGTGRPVRRDTDRNTREISATGSRKTSGRADPAAPPLPERRYLARAATVPESPPISRSASPLVNRATRLDVPPPPPPRRKAVTPPSRPEFSQRVSPDKFHIHNLNGAESFYELEDVDKRGAEWIERITTILHDLDGTGTRVRFFRDSDDRFFEESLQEVDLDL